MKVLPEIDRGSQLNALSCEIEQIEKKITRTAGILATFNNQSEMIGLSKNVAEIHLSSLIEYNQIPPERRKDFDLQLQLEKALKELYDEYMKEFREMRQTREGLTENDGILLIPEKYEELYKNASERLEENIKRLSYDLRFDITQDPLNQQIEIEKIFQMRKVVFEDLLKQKIDHGIEHQDLAPELKTLLSKREKLRDGRVDIKNIFQAIQQGDGHWTNREINKKSSKEIKAFINEHFSNDPHFQPAHMAAFLNMEVILTVLINFGADLKGRDHYGYQPLHAAAKAGSNAALRILLGRGAPVDGKGEYDRTPLHIAAYNNHRIATIELLKAGANPNAQTHKSEKNTPLHEAVCNAHLEIVKILTSSPDLDVNLQDSQGYNPLYYAVKFNLPEILLSLLQHPSWKDSRNPNDPNSLENLFKIKIYGDTGKVISILNAVKFNRDLREYTTQIKKEGRTKFDVKLKEFKIAKKRELKNISWKERKANFDQAVLDKKAELEQRMNNEIDELIIRFRNREPMMI